MLAFVASKHDILEETIAKESSKVSVCNLFERLHLSLQLANVSQRCKFES